LESAPTRKKPRRKSKEQGSLGTTRVLKIGADDLLISERQDNAFFVFVGSTMSRVIRAQYFGTGVDLHPRGFVRMGVAQEAAVMLECRHPNILLLIGMTDMPGGSMLVTERSWGPVSTAMSTEPFSSLTALHIAQQIASALSYLSMRRIQHGAVVMANVWLLKKPSRSRWSMSVKLAQFWRVKPCSGDLVDPAKDIRDFGVFTSNLLLKDFADCVELSGTENLDEELANIDVNLTRMIGEFPQLGFLLKSIVSMRQSTANEVDERFTEVHGVLRDSMRQLERAAAPQKVGQPDGQPPAEELAHLAVQRSQPALQPEPQIRAIRL
jgi:hypothetical protein